MFRSSHPEVFLGKGVLKTCSKFTGEHPCQSVISITLLCTFGRLLLDVSIITLIRVSKLDQKDPTCSEDKMNFYKVFPLSGMHNPSDVKVFLAQLYTSYHQAFKVRLSPSKRVGFICFNESSF